MSSICQLYALLTSHPGSFLDYSAWIALRGYSSSDTGPCPINSKPITEGLWIARYIYDYVTPYLPETYFEHDITLQSLKKPYVESLDTKGFSRLVYLVNRHLILTSTTEFSRFDNSVTNKPTVSETSSAGTEHLDQIIDFEKEIDTHESLDLFLIICLATHAAYNQITSTVQKDSVFAVQWDEETEKRLVEMHNRVFPSDITDPASAHSLPSHAIEVAEEAAADTAAALASTDDEDEESSPLLAQNGAANTHDDDDQDIDNTVFQKSFYDLDGFSRAPLPKENYKAGKDWVALGFQGANPTTDFRATGHLGLKFFESFCLSDPETARNIMAESGSFNGDLTKAWYPVALVSIHMSLFIRKITGGRFLYRGLLLNLDLLSVYELIKTYAQTPQDVNLPELVTTIEKQMSDTLTKLHNKLINHYHKFWRNEVKSGVVKSPLDVDASIIRFQESIQFKLFDGAWSF